MQSSGKHNGGGEKDSWINHISAEALQRIRKDEGFLANLGIIPNAGLEQEFYTVWKTDSNGKVAPNYLDLDAINKKFPDSPRIEKLYSEGNGAYEIVIGKGRGSRRKHYPDKSLKPSVQAVSANAARKIIEEQSIAPEYGIDGITYDASRFGRCPASQQASISLWDEQGSPLFLNKGFTGELGKARTNELTLYCARSLLKAQHEMGALVMTSSGTFNRFSTNNKCKPHLISLGKEKSSGGTLLLRSTETNSNSSQPASFYFENRLPDSDESPALNFLLTISGIAEGVREYCVAKGISTREEWQQHIKSEEFKKLIEVEKCEMPHYPLPKSHTEALKTMEESQISRKLLDDFHTTFCNAYRDNVVSTTCITR